MDFRQQFIEFALVQQVLRFGEFVTKAGRLSPYFFNAGLFNDGNALRRLGQFYAKAILESGIELDQLFGPAYRGIPLGTAAAIGRAFHPALDGILIGDFHELFGGCSAHPSGQIDLDT